MADPLDLLRPHSVRLLVPTLDAHWGIDGRATCALTTPYWTFVWVSEDGLTVVQPGQGRGVPIEFYCLVAGLPVPAWASDVYVAGRPWDGSDWSTSTWADMGGIRTVLEMPDYEWLDCRLPHGWPVQPNPCPVAGVGHPPEPTQGWNYPELMAGVDPISGLPLRLAATYELDPTLGAVQGGLWWF